MCTFPSFWYTENVDWAEMCNSLQEVGEEEGKPTSPNGRCEAISNVITASVYNHQLSSPSAHNDCFPVKGSTVDPTTKKLFHNASERQRRKKLNALYSNLRSVLPTEGNRKRKLSVPAVVGRVLKYIPQLRTQIENVSRQRDELLALRKISEAAVQADVSPKVPIQSGQIFPNVTIISAAASDLLLSIFAYRARLLFSTIVLLLEEERLDIVNASTFVFGNRICYNLHLKGLDEGCILDQNALRLKILCLCE